MIRPFSAIVGCARCAAIAWLAWAMACSKPRLTGDAGTRAVPDAAPATNPPLARETAPTDAGRPASTSPAPTLTLLDPGRPPRRPLRYQWRAGQREELTMDLRTTATTDDADAQSQRIPLPPVRIVIAIDPESVSPSGDLRYRWRVTATDVGADAGAPDSVVDGMRAEVTEVAALSGSAVVTSRGLTREVTIDPAAGLDGGSAPTNGQMVDQVRQTLRDVAAPFPEEDVGVGARWQKLSEVASGDARVTQTETFTLTDVSTWRGTVHDLLAQTAPPQALHAAGMPPGAQARMESMLVSADATTEFDRSRLVPQTRLESTTTMVLSGHSPGDPTHRVGMVLRVEVLLSGKTQ